MNSSNDSCNVHKKSHQSLASMIRLPSDTMSVTDLSNCDDDFTRMDVTSDGSSSKEHDYEFETSKIIPYPYTPTTEELRDYHQLELSLGEDWSLRLACELSSSEMSTDSSDQSSDNDSVTFYDDCMTKSDDVPISSLPPEDIEVRTYTSQGYHA